MTWDYFNNLYKEEVAKTGKLTFEVDLNTEELRQAYKNLLQEVEIINENCNIKKLQEKTCVSKIILSPSNRGGAQISLQN